MKLTTEQIENWRKVLCPVLGPYARLMSDEMVEKIATNMQARINECSGEGIPKFCICDPVVNAKTIHTDGRVTCNKCRLERK